MADLVPREVISFFKMKKLRPSFDYRDTWREEHAFSFTVAKVTQQDILEDIKQGLDDAIANGTTKQQFIKDLRPLLQKKGWWGQRQMEDPKTGEIVDVQLGSPRRLKTIYESNLRSARAAGQWERGQRTKKALPYFVYLLGPSLEHRPEHQSWEGIILPVDHAWWKTHFTPNGYGCKCHVRQISQREADRLLATGNYSTEAPEITYQSWENKRTGETEQIPVGIDPGWNSNPGWLRQANLDRDFLNKAQAFGNIEWATSSILSPVRLKDFAAWTTAMLDNTRPGADLRTVAVMGNAEIEFLSSEGKALQETLTIIEGALLNSGKAKRHIKKGDALSTKQWSILPTLITEASHILYDEKNKQMIYLGETKQKDYPWYKIVIGFNFKSKRAVKAGLAERLNSVRTAFRITGEATQALLGRYQKIK